MKRLKWALVVLTILLPIQNLDLFLALADEGYITTYDHHIMPGELELMIMNDFTAPSNIKRDKDGHGNYFSQMLELEYAPTSQLAFEFMAEGFEDVENGEGKFTGFRYEARYKLFKDEVPLNPVAYVEYEDLHLKTRYKMEVSGWVDPPYDEEGDQPDRERILESRLILSQDIGAWNIAFNWINESDLNSGVTAFGYSLGLLCRVPQFLAQMGYGHPGHVHKKDSNAHLHQKFIEPTAFSFELFGALGDTKSFGLQPSRQEHYFQPSIMFHVGKNTMVNIGIGIGLTKASDNMVRTSLGWMF